MITKYTFKTILILLFFSINNIYSQANNNFQKEINEIKKENTAQKIEYEILKKDFNNLTIQYQQTNDRLNNYLTFTGIIASIFGVLIALSGIYIGFESLKSQRKTKEAIKTLEEAKKYVNNKKTDFDSVIEDKKNLLQTEYDKIIQLFKDKLLNDIELETSKVKDIVSKKSEEIQNISIEEQNNKTIEILEKRLEFFENVSIPDDPEILFSKAKILAEKKMHREAIQMFEKVIEKAPNHNNAYWYLGFQYNLINDIEKSISNYEKHLELFPKNSSALNNVALRYQDKENYLKALDYFDRAIEIDDKSVLYLNNRIKLLIKLNSIEKVIEDYKKLISIDSKKASYYTELINFLKNENREGEVLLYYDKAINEFKENNPEISNYFNLSKAYYLEHINREQDSIDILQKLIDENYKIEECYIKTAELKDKIGKTEEALEILGNGINTNPLSSSLYIYKAFIEKRSNKGNPIQTLQSGFLKINSENFFFSSGQFFNIREFYDLAKYCYEQCFEITGKKITENPENEADLLNHFESLIILRKSIDEFNNTYSNRIISERSQLIYKLLSIINEILNNLNEYNIDNVKDKLLALNIEAKDEKLNWDFKDILNAIKYLNNNNLNNFIKNIIDYVEGKVKIDQL
ncbi:MULTISPECIES: tetratricopeptide repeat protein [unclassified Chryseobacterium]|uniref:tetratricopeptide repeat protein n=1 Tax=unclassified Chryseobacterium TaxID=2593645 RepID=UPI002852F89F|nr:tetratricopeptide repeat protein [Chryseobacterium sp. CFS7]MDR4895001.1 tetratricopeptide repeat protein [Chryseobacterium sp. CFS7]